MEWHHPPIVQKISRFIRSQSHEALLSRQNTVVDKKYDPETYKASKKHPLLQHRNVYKVYPSFCYSEFPFDIKLLRSTNEKFMEWILVFTYKPSRDYLLTELSKCVIPFPDKNTFNILLQ